MIITIYFEADHKKLVSSQKSSIFGPQKGHFGQLGPQNGPPSGQTGTYRKTEGIQSYLRIWRSCHPIESGPSEPKKGWFHRCSVKKCRIFGQKCSFLAPKRATLGNRGPETARRVAKWPPTRKPKVSRVPSGYGGVVIPLSRDRPSQRNGGFIGVA